MKKAKPNVIIFGFEDIVKMGVITENVSLWNKSTRAVCFVNGKHGKVFMEGMAKNGSDAEMHNLKKQFKVCVLVTDSDE